MESGIATLVLALAISQASVTMLFLSWRRRDGSKRPIVFAGWLLVCASALVWIRFGGSEFGIAYATMAVAFAAWVFVAALGREARRSRDQHRQRRVARPIPAWAPIGRTVARALVAVPLAGTTSLLTSVLLITGLPWTITNRYVFAIIVAPIIWGLLAMWVGMTGRLPRVALLLTGVSVLCSALLFVH